MGKTCIHENCKTKPYYNIPGVKNGLYCKNHKLDGMVDVVSKTCIYENCTLQPSYNSPGEKNGLYCKSHSLEGMVDVKHKTCIYENCTLQPYYNSPGEKKGIYCATHKLDGMVDVVSKTCIYENCKTIPKYNNPGEKKGLYCKSHKLDGMVNVKKKTCIYENCILQPYYNTPGEKNGLYCKTHKLDEMVDVVSKTCIYENCTLQPSYNSPGEKNGLYCKSHRLKGMVYVKNKTCKSEWCYTIVNKKYEGYCLYCYMHTYPDKPVTRNYKTKENATVAYIKSKFPNVDWIADKRVTDGCSKRRPDLLLDLGYQVLLIEIDENQHINYDSSCENKRIMLLSQDLGHRPIVFIRFNPDGYFKNGEKITSCWGLNGNGICTVKKSKQSEWNERLSELEKSVKYWTNPEHVTNMAIETIHLFYD